MARSVKFTIPLLKVKSNVIELAEEETCISFGKPHTTAEVIQVIFFNSEKRYLKHYAVMSSEVERLNIDIKYFNLVWIEREMSGLKHEIEAIIK
jgi:hypothetical protein